MPRARTDAVERGRAAFAQRAWGDARAALVAADEHTPLAPEDIELLAIVCDLLGLDDESTEAWTRAHNEHLRLGNAPQAARCAVWLGMSLFDRGEMAPAGGWLAKAAHLLDGVEGDCVERGYLMVPAALGAMYGGDPAGAMPWFERAAELAQRFGDPDLTVMAGLGVGQCRILLGEVEPGLALMDEAMATATTSAVSPIVVGIAYCSTIEACKGIFDVRRAREWTDALDRWCRSQPDLAAFRGQCLVYRAEILRLRGEWREAEGEAERAHQLLSSHAEGGPAYQLGELHRLRGDLDAAEAAYREASRLGEDPMPGLALVRLAQGQPDAAAAMIRRAVEEAHAPVLRCRLLPAFVDIQLAAGDTAAARGGADELAAIAAERDALLLRGLSGGASGAVLLAEGDARGALAASRAAWAAWVELEAPHEAARVRLLIGSACLAMGDRDTAELEFDAARAAFERLGAEPDAARAGELAASVSSPAGSPGLTGREVEVLRLVAAGLTNRAIGSRLFISEKTVARHLSNIFTKLDLSSRSAATAYAYEHDLV